MSDDVIKNPVPKNFQKKIEQIAPVKNGIIGTDKLVPQKKKPALKVERTKKEYDKVALFSEKNVNWEGVGSLKKGYNIVSRESVEKWLSRDHVREATPEEIAEEFGL